MSTEEMAPFVEFLGTLGVPPEDVPDSPARASEMAADVVFARDDTMSLNQIADRAGIESERASQMFSHLGIAIDDNDEIGFGESDVELLKFFVAAVALLTPDEAYELLHVIGGAIGTAAEAAVVGHVQGAETRAVDQLELARINATMATVAIELGNHLSGAFRHHLRQSTARQRRTQSRRVRQQYELTIGFVDLVGFTALTQVLSPSELVNLVNQFESNAYELAHEHGVRVVKMIGDEVMFSSESRSSAGSFALGMVDAFRPTDVVPRGGLASGSVVSVHGDYFGSIVNLAARLVDTAVPGEILVDDVVAMSTDIEAEPAGNRMLKGFDDPVRVHTLLACD